MTLSLQYNQEVDMGVKRKKKKYPKKDFDKKLRDSNDPDSRAVIMNHLTLSGKYEMRSKVEHEDFGPDIRTFCRPLGITVYHEIERIGLSRWPEDRDYYESEITVPYRKKKMFDKLIRQRIECLYWGVHYNLEKAYCINIREIVKYNPQIKNCYKQEPKGTTKGPDTFYRVPKDLWTLKELWRV